MAVTYDALFRINAKATGAAEVRTLGAAISGLTKSAGGLGAVAGAVTGLGVAVGGLGLASIRNRYPARWSSYQRTWERLRPAAERMQRRH